MEDLRSRSGTALAAVRVPLPRRPDALLTGVTDPVRLAVVEELGLTGHLGDADLDAVVDTLADGLLVPITVVNVVTPDLQTYPAEVGVGASCTRVPDGLSFCAEVVDTGRALVVPDARAHPVYRENPLVRAGVIRSYAGAPLVHRGVVVGAVSVFDDTARVFTESQLRVLRSQARLAATVLSLRWAATHDSLTGLPNRRLASERAAASVGAAPLSLLFLDVDDFKGVNDALGHGRGDAVLRDVAGVLRRTTAGTGWTPARWGGDEFLVLAPGTDRAAADALADRLVREIASSGVPTGVTVGVATSAGPCTWDELLLAAGAGLGEGKRQGKGRAQRASVRLAHVNP